MRYILCLFLSGCATNLEYISPPILTTICLTVNWSTKEQIKEICSGHACGEVGFTGGGCSNIWVERPDSFGDEERLRLLGHEVLHSLGATHGKR